MCVFKTLNGLWRNLPVCLEQREEEPVGCGTLDKGDINTLTVKLKEREDGWKTSLWLEKTVLQVLEYFFGGEGRIGVCVRQLWELRHVSVGAVFAICCPWCVEVCVYLGWKSGAGTNNSALSFTPWGVAIVTPRLRRQTGRLFSLQTSAMKNCKFSQLSCFFLWFCMLLCNRGKG